MSGLFGRFFESTNPSETPEIDEVRKRKEGDGKKKKSKEVIEDMRKKNRALMEQYQKVRQKNVELKKRNDELEVSCDTMKKNLNSLKKDSLTELEKERMKTKKWMEKCVQMTKKMSASSKGKLSKKEQMNERMQILQVERDSAISNYEKLEKQNKSYVAAYTKLKKKQKTTYQSFQKKLMELEQEVKKYKALVESGKEEPEIGKTSFDSPTEELRSTYNSEKDSVGMDKSFFEYDRMFNDREEKKKRISGEFESLLSTLND